MSGLVVVLKKELRAFFQSPVALLFLLVFEAATLGNFFFGATWFARNIADCRPLFESMPVLLIVLCASITMRQWAEEQRAGTLELLQTLPVRTIELVLGKFLAGLVLVALALALTLPLPIMAAQLGDLDWGPVAGGYLGAMGVAAAYLAIGLAISALTDNQVVALIGTVAVGAVLYIPGTGMVADLFGTDGARIARSLGTGSRFRSIARGVLDLRDVAYYLAIAASFLGINLFLLERRRIDSGSPSGQSRLRQLALVTMLIVVNAVVLPIWLQPVARARLDLTQNHEYSVSDVTRKTMAELDEPLVIQGVFSQKTHPLLAPLIPQIEDMLREYEVQGRGKVRVEIVDPTTDPDVEQQINEEYGIHPVPFRVNDTHEQSVVNSYFTILVKYGDKYQVLPFEDLIEVHSDGEDVEVRLRNLEYDLTRSIRRASGEFSSLQSMLAKLPPGSEIDFYVSPGAIPESEKPLAELIRTKSQALAAESGGPLSYREVDPATNNALAVELAQNLGVKPFAADLLATTRFWLSLVVRIGDRAEVVPIRAGMGDADLEKAVEATVKRMSPGELKSVGLFSSTPPAPPADPRKPPPPEPQPDYQTAEQVLGQTYTVRRVDLKDGRVPDDLQTLIVAKPGILDDSQRFAIDQFVMRGGALIVLAGRYEVGLEQGAIKPKKADDGLFALLEHYGVRVTDALVMDPNNVKFPIPRAVRRGQFVVREIEQVPYPFFPDIRADGFDRGNPVLSGIDGVTTPWASPIEVIADPVSATSHVILTTSPGSWVSHDGQIEPDFEKYGKAGFPVGTELGPRPVGVILQGKFQSAFAAGSPPAGLESARVLTESPEGTRIAVIGTSELVSDLMVMVAQQPGGEAHRGDVQLVQNLVDWSVEDTDLLQIRSSGLFARTLIPMEAADRSKWQAGQAAFAALALLLVAIVPGALRSATRAIPLPVEAK